MKKIKARPIWRENEFPPNCRSTEEVYKFLRRVGGVNPYGENNYLAVIASEVRTLFGSEFPDYAESADPGKIDFDDERTVVSVPIKIPGSRGHVETINAIVPAGMHVKDKPLRTVKEMRWVQRWPDKEGWALLHWEPDGGGCSRTWWQSWKIPNTDLQCLGPWPERGMYWFFCEGIDIQKKEITLPTFPEIPSHSWMERAIAQFEHNRNQANKIADAQFRQLATLSEWRDRKRKIAEDARTETVKQFADVTRPILSSSLEAGRIREQLAQRARERGVELGHVGN